MPLPSASWPTVRPREAQTPKPRRIGVVSDTHNHLPNARRIAELFNRAEVDRVIHTGDITQAKTLEVLATLCAPLVGVYGNNDLERDTLEPMSHAQGFHFVDPPLYLDWGGRRLCVVHDPRELDAQDIASFDIALHGHTHRYRLERRAEQLIFNPGECAGHLAGYNAVGVVDLVTLETELLRF